jgi:hypothetical protein
MKRLGPALRAGHRARRRGGRPPTSSRGTAATAVSVEPWAAAIASHARGVIRCWEGQRARSEVGLPRHRHRLRLEAAAHLRRHKVRCPRRSGPHRRHHAPAHSARCRGSSPPPGRTPCVALISPATISAAPSTPSARNAERTLDVLSGGRFEFQPTRRRLSALAWSATCPEAARPKAGGLSHRRAPRPLTSLLIADASGLRPRDVVPEQGARLEVGQKTVFAEP